MVDMVQIKLLRTEKKREESTFVRKGSLFVHKQKLKVKVWIFVSLWKKKESLDFILSNEVIVEGLKENYFYNLTLEWGERLHPTE